MLNLSESKLLLDIVSQRQPVSFDNINAGKFVDLVNFHSLAPLVFCKLQKHTQQTPKEICSSLKTTYLNNIAINLRLWNAFLKINAVFTQNNISILPLKGMDIFTRFYPVFDLRSTADIDIVIREEQFSRVEETLSGLGYRKNNFGLKEDYWRKEQCHISFCGNQIMVEAHWGLDFKRGARVILPKLWERAAPLEAGGQKINILSAEDALFSFALHLRRFGNILSLKQVMDASRIIKESPEFDWDYLFNEARRGKMESTLYFILTQVNLFTETPIPQKFIKQLSVANWKRKLIKEFILKYTFDSQSSLKKNYLKAHFLLYDNFFEPIWYVIRIPYEQFCKFYAFKPYTFAADLSYRLRLFYMPLAFLLKRNPKRTV